MREDGRIDPREAEAARAEPLVVYRRDNADVVKAGYFAEEIRRELARLYGEDGLYSGGLSVRTTLDPRLQAIADRVLRQGLIDYDRRHGWRGPLREVPVDAGADVAALLQQIERPEGIDANWELAALPQTDAEQAAIRLADSGPARIPTAELPCPSQWIAGQPTPYHPTHPTSDTPRQRREWYSPKQ